SHILPWIGPWQPKQSVISAKLLGSQASSSVCGIFSPNARCIMNSTSLPSPQDTSHGDTGSSPAHCIADVSSGHLARVRRNTHLVENANGAIHQTTFAYQQVFNIDLQRQALTNRGKSR